MDSLLFLSHFSFSFRYDTKAALRILVIIIKVGTGEYKVIGRESMWVSLWLLPWDSNKYHLMIAAEHLRAFQTKEKFAAAPMLQNWMPAAKLLSFQYKPLITILFWNFLSQLNEWSQWHSKVCNSVWYKIESRNTGYEHHINSEYKKIQWSQAYHTAPEMHNFVWRYPSKN